MLLRDGLYKENIVAVCNSRERVGYDQAGHSKRGDNQAKIYLYSESRYVWQDVDFFSLRKWQFSLG